MYTNFPEWSKLNVGSSRPSYYNDKMSGKVTGNDLLIP